MLEALQTEKILQKVRQLNENPLSNYGSDCVEKVITKGMEKFKNEIKSSWR